MTSNFTKKEVRNAFAAYADILWKCYLGTEDVPAKFEEFKTLNDTELFFRIKVLKDFYRDTFEEEL